MKSIPREVLFKACPNLDCGRKSRCLKLAMGSKCLKTHFRDKDEFYDMLTARIHELQKLGDDDPESKHLVGEERAAYVYQALLEREQEFKGKRL